MIYKVIIYNKSKENISYILYDCLDELDKKNEKTIVIKPDDIKEIPTDSTISNIKLWNDITKAEWNGTIPTDVYLEIFQKDGKIDVFLDNDKLPQSIVKNIKDCNNKFNYKYLIFFILLVIAIGLICYFSSKRKDCKSCVPRRYRRNRK